MYRGGFQGKHSVENTFVSDIALSQLWLSYVPDYSVQIYLFF